MLKSKVLQKLVLNVVLVILVLLPLSGTLAVSTKDGVSLKGLKPEILNILPVLDRIHAKVVLSRETVITDAISSRPYKSLHPQGYAIDIRIRDLTDEEVLNLYVEIVMAIGQCYDVVQEDDHIHIEYDPIIGRCDPHQLEFCDTRE